MLRAAYVVFWVAVIAALYLTVEQQWQAAGLACLWAILAVALLAGFGIEERVDRIHSLIEKKFDEVLLTITSPSDERIDEMLAEISNKAAHDQNEADEDPAAEE